MHPWLLHNPPISTYGTCLVAALLAAWAWARLRARRAALDPSRIDLLMPLILGLGLLGAWSFGRLTDALTGGGGDSANSAVLVGSLLLSTAAGIGYALWSRIPLGILGDIVAPPLALGIGIGRIGCFFAGCCFGKICTQPTPLTAVTFPPGSFAALLQHQPAESLPVYPVQLYESAACLLLAFLLWRWRPTDLRGITGQKFLAVGLSYAAIRFCLEFLRGDNPPIHDLTFSQWGAIVIALLAAATWILRLRYQDRWHVRRPA
jgi:phosphatidylglycerol:prolipoprotein diacylglycerol transferase